MNQSDKISKEDLDVVESLPLSDEMLARMRPVKEAHPDLPHRVRGPQKSLVKVPVSIRLNPEIVRYFKSQGKGWQTRINEVLAEYVTDKQGGEMVDD